MTLLSLRAFDSDGWLDLAAAKAQGAIACGLYAGFNLTQAQANDAASLGLGLWTFWENQASDPNGGGPQGITDAHMAADLVDLLHGAHGSAIYMPNDQMVNDWTATLAYFQAAAGVLKSRGYAPGFYGQTSVWNSVKSYGYRYFCKAPDGTQDNSQANIVQNVSPQIQINGVSCDVDIIQTADFGGWNSKGLWYARPMPRKAPDMFTFQDPNSAKRYLACGHPAVYIPTKGDLDALHAAGIPDIKVSDAFFKSLTA